MTPKLKPLEEQVMVITGASSGIGLATARRAVASGVRVVLTARNEEALANVTESLTADGGQAVAVPADVADRAAMQRVADTAAQRFGGFDSWVNNAGVSIYGRLDEVDEADSRRMFDTNFWGMVHGSLIARRHLLSRGGALINIGSVASDQALPLQGMYSATKHAVKGFTDALRMEIEEEGAPISVTLIKPAGINTPFPQHARNYMDAEPKLPPPVYPAEEVANAILHAATHPVRDIYVGGGGKVMSALGRRVPRVMDWLAEQTMIGQQRRDEPPRDPAGSLHQPGRDGRVEGDHPGYVMRTSAYTRAALNPMVVGTLGVAGLAAYAWLRNGGSRESIPRPRQAGRRRR